MRAHREGQKRHVHRQGGAAAHARGDALGAEGAGVLFAAHARQRVRHQVGVEGFANRSVFRSRLAGDRHEGSTRANVRVPTVSCPDVFRFTPRACFRAVFLVAGVHRRERLGGARIVPAQVHARHRELAIRRERVRHRDCRGGHLVAPRRERLRAHGRVCVHRCLQREHQRRRGGAGSARLARGGQHQETPRRRFYRRGVREARVGDVVVRVLLRLGDGGRAQHAQRRLLFGAQPHHRLLERELLRRGLRPDEPRAVGDGDVGGVGQRHVPLRHRPEAARERHGGFRDQRRQRLVQEQREQDALTRGGVRDDDARVRDVSVLLSQRL